MKSIKQLIIYIFFVIISLFIITNIRFNNIKSNVKISAEKIANDGLYPMFIKNAYITAIDSSGDLIILNEIYTSGSKNIIENTLGIPVMQYKNYSMYMPEANYINITRDTKTTTLYPQYWHGYLIIYKLLFNFFTLDTIRILMCVIYAFILIYTLFVALKHKLNFLYWILFAQIPFILPFGIMNLETAPVFFVMMASVLLLIKNNGKINITLIFSGFLTAFFDFLTVENLVLSILLYVLYIYKKYNIKQLFKSACLWSISYILTFIIKWGIVTIFIDKTFFMKIPALFARTKYGVIQPTTALYNVFDTLLFNQNVVYIFLLIFILMILIKKVFIKELFFILSIPLIRTIILPGHSDLHRLFTCRYLIIFLIILLTIIFRKGLAKNIFKHS